MGQLLALRRQNEPQNLDNETNTGEEAAWWCKLLARGVTSFGAGVALMMGFWRCFATEPRCIASGIIQVMIAFIVLVMELHCCFQYADFARPISNFSEKRTFLQRAMIYGGLSLIPIILCFSIPTIFGAGLIFAGASLYGLMAVGKKADRQQMANNAAKPTSPDGKDTLIENDYNQAYNNP